jgi:hypothetical protein
MKSDLVHSRVQMEPNILKRLVTEVHETVATDVHQVKEKKTAFGIVSLWNIRRNGRYAAHTRHRKPRIVTGIGY